MTLLTVGLLAMLGSSALDTRAIMRERNIDLAAIYAARRLELLRLNACTLPQHNDSSELLMRGADSLAKNSWTYFSRTDALGNVHWEITLTNNYFKAPVRMYGDTRARDIVTRRSDTYKVVVTCAQ
jgi:hypothetical protein